MKQNEKRNIQAPVGAIIENVTVIAESSKITGDILSAIVELAKASARHADALQTMAMAMRGEGGRIDGSAINISDVTGSSQEKAK